MLQMNVLNEGRFFRQVNACLGPVRLHAAGQEPVDLRGNGFLQGLLAAQGSPIRLAVQPENGADTARLIRFMQEDGRRD